MSLATYAPVLDAVRGMGWPARQRVRSMMPGPHASVVRGTTAEFIEYRPYRQGDDPKRIDWKLVARTDRVYVRISQERSILPTMMVVDASASMAFPPESNAKWELARRLAVGLAAVARERGDPVGLVVAHAGGLNVVAPRTRRTVLDEMMLALEVEPGGTGGPSYDVRLEPAAIDALRLGARVVLLTDFLGDADAVLATARTSAAAGHELYAVHVVAAGELEPDPKKLLVTDPERPALRRPLPPAARTAYQRRFQAWRDELARAWRGTGALYLMVVPGQEPFRRTIRRITAGVERRRPTPSLPALGGGASKRRSSS